MTAIASLWRMLIGRCRRDDEAEAVKRASRAETAAIREDIERSLRATDSMVAMLLQDKHPPND